VLRRDVADQLLDEHRLADARAAEQSDLAAALIRREQVDDLDAGLEQLLLVSCSSNGGEARWIGSLCFAFTGPLPSIVSPTRLKMRPRHSSPTGTVIGAPVSVAGMPRTSPSVESMAMQRTTLSPTCSAAST
jgi:hypothetical protein